MARGHENISASHKTTFEITKESELSRRGDCIIAVAADKATNDLCSAVKERLRRNDAKVTILVEAGGIAETVNARGDSGLILDHPTEIVVRRSGHTSDRTLAIRADKAAYDLSRRLVQKLRSPNERVKITITVKT
jgi:hypothetical protein